MGLFDSVLSKLLPQENPENKPIQTASDQTEEEKALCGFVKSKLEDIRAQSNRVSHEGIWMTNIAYALGYDSVYYDPNYKQFRPSNSAGRYVRRNRTHENLILPAMQNRLARMVKSPPKYEVRPNSMEQEDKEGAKLGEQIIGLVFDKNHTDRKRIELGMWVQECGHAYIKVCYDGTLGRALVDPVSGDLAGYEGDIRLDVVSAFECFPDPLAKSLEECTYFIQAKVRKLDYFRSHYGERGALVKEEGAWLLSAQYEMRINTLSTAGPNNSGTTEQMKNAAIEISYYERPSKNHPDGRHIIVANGVLLKNDDLPCGEIPFAKFDDIVVGGKYYSESIVTHARPLQDQYNEALVKRAEWVRKNLAGKYITARGHNLSEESLNDRSGEVVKYDPVPMASEPHAMQIPLVPEYAFKQTDVIKRELQVEIFGLSDISRGQLPSSSIPAKGMEILVEQDETRIGVEVAQHEDAWAKVGTLILKYVDKHYVMPRQLKTKSKTNEYQIREFTGSDLRANFDVTVIRGSTVPNNKTLKRQDIMNLYQNGLLGNPQDPATQEKALGMMEFGDIGEAWEDRNLDLQQIKRTIEQIEAGEIPEVDLMDNHPLHIQMKNRYRKSEKFGLLSPEQRMVFANDIKAHLQAQTRLSNPQLFMPPQMPPEPIPAEMADQMAQGVEQGSQMQPTEQMPPPAV